VTPPTASLNVTANGGLSFTFDMSGSSDYTVISIDYGDGNTADGIVRSDYAYASAGVYTAIVTATNKNGSSTASAMVVAASTETETTAYFAQPYIYVVSVPAGSGTPVISGAVWLSVTDVGNGYVVVSGTPSSTGFVERTYNMILSAGSHVTEWSVTVRGGPGYPAPGFTAHVDGMKVTITPTATNVSTIEYDMGDGQTISNRGTFTHTYSEPGPYTIKQTVSKSINGSAVQLQFSRQIVASASQTGDGGDGGDGGNEGDSGKDVLGSKTFIAALAILIVSVVAMIAIPVAPRRLLAVVAMAAAAYIVWVIL